MRLAWPVRLLRHNADDVTSCDIRNPLPVTGHSWLDAPDHSDTTENKAGNSVHGVPQRPPVANLPLTAFENELHDDETETVIEQQCKVSCCGIYYLR